MLVRDMACDGEKIGFGAAYDLVLLYTQQAEKYLLGEIRHIGRVSGAREEKSPQAMTILGGKGGHERLAAFRKQIRVPRQFFPGAVERFAAKSIHGPSAAAELLFIFNGLRSKRAVLPVNDPADVSRRTVRRRYSLAAPYGVEAPWRRRTGCSPSGGGEPARWQ